jgi:hypothetical protein
MMSKKTQLSAAQQARQKVRLLRENLLRRAGDPPVVEDLLPAIKGDEVSKLQLSRQGRDCVVTFSNVKIPDSAPPGEVDIVLLSDGFAVSDWEALPNPVPSDFTMILGGLHTATPGLFRLQYKTLYASQPNTSDTSVFYIDNVAPNHGVPGKQPEAPAEIINGVITKEILDSPDKIFMIIDPPDDTKAGDIYSASYGKIDFSLPAGNFIVDEDPTRPIEIELPKAIVQQFGQGEFIYFCTYADRVGNVGPPSEPLQLRVRLTPAPSALQPPEVPENDDGVVDLNDAYPDVAVVIPTFTNGMPGDKVRVTWGGRAQALKDTDGTAQVIVDVPFAEVTAGGDGPETVHVSYAIVRDGVDYPEPTGVDVDIDFTVPGPVNPNPDPDPGIGNPNLPTLVVKGSTDDDTLVEADVGSDVDIELTIYTERKSGDLVDLYWESVKVPPPNGRYVVVGTEAADFKIPFKLPSSIFEATGNGLKKAHYVVSNPTDNGDNENPSTRTEVDVYIMPVTLPPPVIQNIFVNDAGRKYVDCSSLREIPVVGKAVIVKVIGDSSFAVGMTLQFTWVGTQYGPSPIPIDDYPIEKILQGSEPAAGFEVYLPYYDSLKPIKDGLGSITYTAVIDGRTHTSAKHEERVVMIDNESNFCPGT